MNKSSERLLKSIKSLHWYEWVMIGIMTIVAAFAVVTSFMGYNPITGKADYNPSWLAIINFVSALAGIMCIFFCAKASISNFVFGIVNTFVYIVYLLYWGFLAPESLRWATQGTLVLETVVYMPVNFISWFVWAKHRDAVENCDHLTKSKKLTWWQNVIVTFAIAGVTVLTRYTFMEVLGLKAWAKLTTEPVLYEIGSWLDAATFSIGIVAVFLEMFRYREQYVWWLITDIVAVALYSIKTPFDPVYLTKKSIYLIMAIIGLINWIKLQKLHNVENK